MVMDIADFYKRERQLNIREQLLDVEAGRLRGNPDFPAHEVIAEGRAELRAVSGGAVRE